MTNLNDLADVAEYVGRAELLPAYHTFNQLNTNICCFTLEEVKFTSRFQYTGIVVDGGIRFVDTTSLYTWTNISNLNPITNKPFSNPEMEYIRFHRVGKSLEPSYKHVYVYMFINYLRHGLVIPYFLKFISYFISINHFRDWYFDFSTDEAKSAVAKLIDQPNNTWLLRSSSRRRGVELDINTRDLIGRYHLKIYVLSFKQNDNVYHFRFIHKIGFGWANIYDIQSNNNKLIFYTNRKKTQHVKIWNPNFLEFLKNKLARHNLKFVDYISFKPIQKLD